MPPVDYAAFVGVPYADGYYESDTATISVGN